MPRHCWQQGGLGYGRPRLRLGRGRLAATRTRAGRRPSGCAAVADTAAQPPQRRCDLAKLAGPQRRGRRLRRAIGASLSNVAVHTAQLHSPRPSAQMQNRFNRNIFQGAEFKASQPKLGQAASSSGSGLRRCGPAAPLHWGAAAGGSAAVGAAATGISLGRAGRVAAPPSLIRPLRLGRAAVAAAAAAPRRLETAQRLAARHASGV